VVILWFVAMDMELGLLYEEAQKMIGLREQQKINCVISKAINFIVRVIKTGIIFICALLALNGVIF
jgi:hypothetical protein